MRKHERERKEGEDEETGGGGAAAATARARRHCLFCFLCGGWGRLRRAARRRERLEKQRENVRVGWGRVRGATKRRRTGQKRAVGETTTTRRQRRAR